MHIHTHSKQQTVLGGWIKKGVLGSVSDNSCLPDRLTGELMSDGKGKKNKKFDQAITK